MVITNNFYNFIKKTPLDFNKRLSKIFGNNIYLKREDLQKTRSFKLRGVTNKIIKILYDCKKRGIICASTGNHAQGISYMCNKFNIYGTVYLPNNTPNQKIKKIMYYGGDYINIVKYSNNFNEVLNRALSESLKTNEMFIHPYDDIDIIEGQSTIGKEIMEQNNNVDYIMASLGGGGLISGIYSATNNKKCKIVGVEPKGANSFNKAIRYNRPYNIKYIDTFVDGAAVSKIGKIPFKMLQNNIDVYTSSNEDICNIIIDFYNYEGIIMEPAGAMAVAGLNKLCSNIKNKNIVCVISGGNNDIYRYNEIIEIYKKNNLI